MKKMICCYDMDKEMRIISQYRSCIMAIAIISVVLFHTGIKVDNSIIQFCIHVGYGGVDIFFFLSGIGIWYSLEKNDTYTFYKRRLLRLLPAYIPFICIWFLVVKIMGTNDIGGLSTYIDMLKDFLGNIVMLGWMNGLDNQFNWYIQALLWFYLIAPLFYGLVKRNNDAWNILLFFAFACMCIVCFDNIILMAVSRFPIFFLGILWAEWANQKRKTNKIIIYGLMFLGGVALAFFVLQYSEYLWKYGLWWYPFFLVVPGMCSIIGNICVQIEKKDWCAWVIRILNVVGECSFEIYLVHIAIFDVVPKVINVENSDWWKIIILSIAAGILYKKIVDKCFMWKRNICGGME